jgi:hypothetical protein
MKRSIPGPLVHPSDVVREALEVGLESLEMNLSMNEKCSTKGCDRARSDVLFVG